MAGWVVPRPETRGLDVVTTLEDFAIVTWDVSPDALAAHLPGGFLPDVFTLDDGRPRSFVSAVPFRDRDFRFARAPFARFDFPQTNYRAYGRHGGVRGVWFFGTTLGTPFVRVPQLAWRLPWHRASFAFDTVWEFGVAKRYRVEAAGNWGESIIDLAGTDVPTGRLDGFRDADETARVLTHPLVGWMRRTDGALTSYSVWHDRLDLRRARVNVASCRVFEDLGLVAPTQPPHSALVQKATDFIVKLPPRRLETT